MNEIIDSEFKIFSEPQKILGWHFSKDTKLGYKDKRPIIIGETLSVEGEIIPCVFGLHASEKALDAFQYVRGNYLWRVELEGDLKSHANSNEIVDKWVARKRKVLAGGDATEMLKKFARDCALDVLHLLPNAPEEVKTFLETGVITDFVDNYFAFYNVIYNADYNVNNSYAYAAYYAYYDAYCVCKTNNISYIYNAIDYATDALDVDIKTYTDKFEETCLNFIAKKC